MPLRRTRCPLITIFFLSFFLSLEMLLTCSVMATLTFEIFVIGMVGRAARVLDSSKIIGLCLLPPPNFTVQCPMNQNAEEIGLPAFGRDTFVLGRCTEAHKRGPKYVPETAAGPTFGIIYGPSGPFASRISDLNISDRSVLFSLSLSPLLSLCGAQA